MTSPSAAVLAKPTHSFWRFTFFWLILMTMAWAIARIIPAESRQKMFYREFFILLVSVMGLLVGLLRWYGSHFANEKTRVPAFFGFSHLTVVGERER